MIKPIPELTERQLRNFWAKIDKRGPDECWEWQGCFRRSCGYGAFQLSPTTYRAHRVAYKLAKGEPGDFFVCHSCDNKKCCNPNHLWLGTCADNQRDMAEKCRAPRGEKNGRSILTLAQVTEIKAALKNHRRGMNEALAKKYLVSRHLISKIKIGRNWQYV